MQLISTNRTSQGKHGTYNAVDISPDPDPDYYAPEDGTITALGDSGTCGLRLELTGPTGRHGFCHNEKIFVKVGDKVKRGQRLAKMGYTGYTQPDNDPAGTHVHWVINKGGIYVYPPSLVNQSFIKLEGGDVEKDKIIEDLKHRIDALVKREEELEHRIDALAAENTALRAEIKPLAPGKYLVN